MFEADMKLFSTTLLILLFVFSCKKGFDGEINPQLAPETYMSADSIFRSGTDRLTTTITANWWATSAGGYIIAYEVSIDSMQNWTYTTRQDSTILLSIPVGKDTADLNIYVRAIDNLGQRDLTPASLSFPVKNSAPLISNDSISGRKPIISFPAVNFKWKANDADGKEDIQGFEIYLNDTTNPVINLSNSVNEVTIMADTFFGNECFVFLANKTNPLSTKIKGIKYNGLNNFYVRAYDRTGAKSNWAINSIYIKKPVSSVLLVNAYVSAKMIPQNFITQRIVPFIPVFDTMQLTDYSVALLTYTELSPDNLTQARVFSFFKKIIWFSDDPYNTFSLAQQSTSNFFTNGGKMFLLTEFTSDFPSNYSYLGFTPVESLIVPDSGIIRMNIGAEMKPYDTSNGLPALKASSIISSARPFKTPLVPSGTFTYDSLYGANLILSTSLGIYSWTGISNVISKRISLIDNKPNIVFMSLPLHRLNGNNNVDIFLQKILINELGF